MYAHLCNPLHAPEPNESIQRPRARRPSGRSAPQWRFTPPPRGLFLPPPSPAAAPPRAPPRYSGAVPTSPGSRVPPRPVCGGGSGLKLRRQLTERGRRHTAQTAHQPAAWSTSVTQLPCRIAPTLPSPFTSESPTCEPTRRRRRATGGRRGPRGRAHRERLRLRRALEAVLGRRRAQKRVRPGNREACGRLPEPTPAPPGGVCGDRAG